MLKQSCHDWVELVCRAVTTISGLLGLGLAVLMIGLMPASLFSVATGAMFIVGMMMPIVNGPIMAIMQVTVAPDMQGRVFTLLGSAAAAMSPLGLAIAGPIADWLGVQTWYIAGGIVCFLMGVGGFFLPAVAQIEENRERGATPT